MKKQIVQKIFRVVLYLRLSSDDGDNSESADATLQEGMKKVVAWSEEREGLMNGSKNIEQKKTR